MQLGFSSFHNAENTGISQMIYGTMVNMGGICGTSIAAWYQRRNALNCSSWRTSASVMRMQRWQPTKLKLQQMSSSAQLDQSADSAVTATADATLDKVDGSSGIGFCSKSRSSSSFSRISASTCFCSRFTYQWSVAG